jgi:hypothetical protein
MKRTKYFFSALFMLAVIYAIIWAVALYHCGYTGICDP